MKTLTIRHGFIYEIRNTINNKRYVGSTVSLKERWKLHINNLRKGTHHSLLLQRAFDKYGLDAFEFNVLECVLDSRHNLQIEQKYLDTKPEYNRALKAGAPRLGAKSTPEHCARMSAALKGRAGVNNGKKFSDEHKEKISKALTGYRRGPMSDELKQKRSEALLAYWSRMREQDTMPKRKLTEAHKANIKASLLARKNK
jgi:group I intron endonuclease